MNEGGRTGKALSCSFYLSKKECQNFEWQEYEHKEKRKGAEKKA